MNDDSQDPVERLLDECLAVPSDPWQAALAVARDEHPEPAGELGRGPIAGTVRRARSAV